MKVVKRKTQIKCPYCKKTVVGFKLPATLKGFSCQVEYNENIGTRNVRWERNGKRNLQRVCKQCETKF